jgi:putative SOS response-associated peptidase YedK
MCGRYVSPREAALERYFNLTRGGGKLLDAHYNAAPTQLLPVYRVHPKHGPELVELRWGLIPYWAKDPAIGVKSINARAETLAERPAFQSAFRRRRCLVPMMGFYEWRKTPAGKVPHYIHLLNSEVFAVAGLHEWWPGKDGAAPIESFTIITTDANALVSSLHDRMPVILREDAHAKWLDPKNEKTDELGRLLKPFPADEMRAYPVSTRVNDVKNDDAQLLDPHDPPIRQLTLGDD